MIRFAHNEADKEHWNNFVLKTPSASFFTVSNWLDSYKSFGAKIMYLLSFDDITKEINGGCALIVMKLGPFRWIQIPHGPVAGDQETANALLEEVETFANSLNTMAIQVSPFQLTKDDANLKEEAERNKLTYKPNLFGFQDHVSSILLKRGYIQKEIFNLLKAPQVGQIVSLESPDILMQFRKGTRRDIRYSLSSGIECVTANTLELFRESYKILKINGNEKGYDVRPWNTFYPSIWKGQNKGTSTTLLASYKGEFIATVIVLFGGKRGVYAMGGTKRLESAAHIYPAHFLQYMAMQETIKRGYKQYDLTAIANKGVATFKRGFRPDFYRLNGTFSLIQKSNTTQLFQKILPLVNINKRKVAKAINYIQGRKD